MARGDENGWWGVPPMQAWKCPDCGKTSPAADWAKSHVSCEECGDHDARECPKCGSVFDHVWGDEKIARANGS